MCPSLIEIGSKTAEKNSAQTNKQTDKQTLRKQWSLGREPKVVREHLPAVRTKTNMCSVIKIYIDSRGPTPTTERQHTAPAYHTPIRLSENN